MIKSIGVLNMIDMLSGKNNLYIPGQDEEKVRKLLLGHSINKINDNILELDNGVQLEFIANEGCCCGAGTYNITELNDCENIITNVELITERKNYSDGWSEVFSYKIFVYAENKQIKLLQCDGDDGNGYYGTGYHINIKLKENNNVERN
jgi:hypothetical protein